MHNYPSDITREQFEIIREDLENAKKRTKPRKYDLYDIFCEILYVLRGGIQVERMPLIISRDGNWCTITSWDGQSPMQKGTVYLKGF